jgi:hypothetical protein
MNTPTQLRKTQMPAREPFHLCNLVAYQEGMVPSRPLIKHAGGTLTLFVFDVGQGLTEHTAARCACSDHRRKCRNCHFG